MNKKSQWKFVTVLIYSLTVLTSCSKEDNTRLSEQELFEQEMTAALADAQVYGPHTQAFAVEVAERFSNR